MRKKKKQNIFISVLIVGLVFPIILKVLNLNVFELLALIALFKVLKEFYSDFNLREALLTKLSIIT